jgi:hypothetical protein
MLYQGILIGIIIGVVGITFVIPILQQLSSVVVNLLEVINGYSTRNVTKRNAEITLIQSEVEDKTTPIATNVMGYEVPNEGWIYGDECKTKTPIGF